MVVAAAVVPTTALGGPFFPLLGLQAVLLGLQAKGGPLAPRTGRAPQLSTADLLRTALQTQALSERGLVPVVSTDPFTGNVVISTSDQSAGLFNLLGERFAREALVSTEEENRQIFIDRQALIEERRRNPVFPTPVEAPVETTVREQVIAPLVRTSPTQIAPGVVSSALPQPTGRRLGGPCAGITTGFARLNCGRGGFS